MFKNKKTILGNLCFIIPVILIMITASNILLYADDYYYGTFLRNGLHGFVNNNISHFLNYNGRVIVHIIDQLILPLGPFVYSLICIFLLILLFCLAASVIKSEKKNYLTLCICFVLFIPAQILRESLFWTSAMVNYLYPSVMLMALILILKNSYEKKHIGAGGLLICFICGATTEQIGSCAVFLTLLFFAAEPSKKLSVFVRSALMSVAGLLSIFLSPATRMRLNTENAPFYDLMQTIYIRLSELSDKLLNLNGAGFFCLLFVFTVILFSKNKFFKYFSAIFEGLLFIYICFFRKTEIFNVIVLLLFTSYFIAAVILMLASYDFRYHGICMCAGAFSVLVMLKTNSLTYRTLLPIILITIAVSSDLILRNIKHKEFLIYAFALSGMVVFVPVSNGYIQNKMIDSKNIKQFDEPIINYCIDYNDKYRHQMLQDDAFFYDTAREYYGIKNNQIIYFYSDKSPGIMANGKKITYPCLDISGKKYIPFSLIIEAFGGSKNYIDGIASFNYNNNVYSYNLSENSISYDNNTTLLFDSCITTVYSCMEINTACEIFDWSYSQEDNLIRVFEK